MFTLFPCYTFVKVKGEKCWNCFLAIIQHRTVRFISSKDKNVSLSPHCVLKGEQSKFKSENTNIRKSFFGRNFAECGLTYFKYRPQYSSSGLDMHAVPGTACFRVTFYMYFVPCCVQTCTEWICRKFQACGYEDVRGWCECSNVRSIWRQQ